MLCIQAQNWLWHPEQSRAKALRRKMKVDSVLKGYLTTPYPTKWSLMIWSHYNSRWNKRWSISSWARCRNHIYAVESLEPQREKAWLLSTRTVYHGTNSITILQKDMIYPHQHKWICLHPYPQLECYWRYLWLHSRRREQGSLKTLIQSKLSNNLIK